MKKIIKKMANKFGYDIVAKRSLRDILHETTTFSSEGIDICEKVEGYTMTEPVRVNAIVDSVRYIHRTGVVGDMVECGVFKGGSAMAMAYSLNLVGDTERNIYMYDTFEGMTKPTEHDVNILDELADDKFKLTKLSDDSSDWVNCSLDDVKANLARTGYPEDKLVYVKGKVEDTLPGIMPEKISLLRLDTDWYESTKMEMEHLFERLSPHGVLILDDYGHWKGARKAVDEYIENNKIKIFLHPVDYACRIALKLG